MFVELTPLEETRSYKELVAIGKKEGKKEGEKKATKRLIARMIANKFNIKIQRITPRLKSLRIKDMIELGDNIFTMNSLEDAFQWINSRKKKLTMA